MQGEIECLKLIDQRVFSEFWPLENITNFYEETINKANRLFLIIDYFIRKELITTIKEKINLADKFYEMFKEWEDEEINDDQSSRNTEPLVKKKIKNN